MTHDYKRNRTASLYAVLEIATGEVTGACYPQHIHQQFLASLSQLVRAYPQPAPARRAGQLLNALNPGSQPPWMNVIEMWFSILPDSRSAAASTTTSPS